MNTLKSSELQCIAGGDDYLAHQVLITGLPPMPRPPTYVTRANERQLEWQMQRLIKDQEDHDAGGCLVHRYELVFVANP